MYGPDCIVLYCIVCLLNAPERKITHIHYILFVPKSTPDILNNYNNKTFLNIHSL